MSDTEKEHYGAYTSEEFAAMTDEELVAIAKVLDCGASDELYHRYKWMVRAKARPYFLMGADREDLVQEGMVGFFKAIRDYDNEKNNRFRPFAELCVTRQLMTAIKAASRDKHMPLNRYESLYTPVYEDSPNRHLMDTLDVGTVESPEELFIKGELSNAISEVLSTSLTELEQSVLVRYLRGMSYFRIAEELGKTVKSVDNALQRIKKKLEHALDEGRIDAG